MIPEFPEFKKLELSDKTEIENFTKKFPPYSDFNFVSMWSWDFKEEMLISILNENLVIRFTDYLSGDPFYTFLGTNMVDQTSQILLKHSVDQGLDETLNLIVQDVIDHIDKKESNLCIHEKNDHHDYIYSVEGLINYEGSSLKVPRNTLNSFLRRYPHYRSQIIDLNDPSIQSAILRLNKIWEINTNSSVPHEFAALKKCLSCASELPIWGIGIFVNDVLIGFNINQIDSQDFATCFFAKGDVKYYGIYSVLMNETAKILSNKYNVKYFNYEQDLGLFSLRKSKKAFNPVYFLKKYSVIKGTE